MTAPTPFDWQVSHIEKCYDYIQKRNYYIDNSDTGLGKTYINGFLCKKLEVDGVFIVCPKSILETWKSVFESFGIKILNITTYESFRGTEANPPKHGYLKMQTEKHVDRNEKTIKKIKYLSTEKLKTFCQKRVMFVFDEFHKCKNNSLQSKAIFGLNKYLRSISNCFSAFLTATNYTDSSNSWNLFRALGLSEHDVLFEHNLYHDTYDLLGHKDIVEYGKTLDSQCGYNLQFMTKKRIEEETHQILTKFIFPHVMSALPRQKFEYEIVNKCVVANNCVSDLCQKLINAISVIIRDHELEGMGNLRLMMHILEIIKAYYVVSMVKKKLATNPNSKIVIYVNYLDVLNYIKDKLSNYHPLILHGQTPLKVRAEVVNLFNEPNLKERVFISIMTAGGTGISLHDTHGEFPRETFIMSDYQLIAIKQCFGRTIRAEMKSKSVVNLCYMMPIEESQKKDKSVIEFKVFKALNKKSDVLRETMAKENYNQKLPSDLKLKCQYMQEHDLIPQELIRQVLKNYNNKNTLESIEAKIPWVFDRDQVLVWPIQPRSLISRQGFLSTGVLYNEPPPAYYRTESEANILADSLEVSLNIF